MKGCRNIALQDNLNLKGTNMNELIKLNETNIGNELVQAVSARELHAFLGNGDMFANWIKNRIEKYGFVENQDFVSFLETTKKPNGGRPSREYYITLDMAKQLTMVENNEKGMQVRKYFIECEKKQAQALKELSSISYQHPDNLVFSLAGNLYTTSISLATVSGKKHYHVLRDINEEIAELEMNPNLDPLIRNRLLKGFSKATYKDSMGRTKVCYQLSEEAFLQMSLKYSAEVRARFVTAFVDYRDTLINLYKARIIEKVLPQVSSSRSFVYIIREEGNKRFKIGVSNNPDKRLKTLQTGNPEDLTLLYTSLVCSNSFEIETYVHEHFKDYLLRGEWFDPSLDIKEVIVYLESQRYVLESEFDLSFDTKLLNFINGDD